ncbi:hypothetical protein ACEN4K_10270 [Marinilactibacillus psychrotolerans]|uniref:hypothetical protein n=1 Tax=Marinilactibacillus psychrotolerans TaxID=191770 RepID=UPI003888784F
MILKNKFKYLWLFGLVFTFSLLFGGIQTFASENELTEEQIEQTVIEAGYDFDEVEIVSIDPVNPLNKLIETPIKTGYSITAYSTNVISAAFQDVDRSTGARIGGRYNIRYKTLNVRNGYKLTHSIGVFYKNKTSSVKTIDYIYYYKTW